MCSSAGGASPLRLSVAVTKRAEVPGPAAGALVGAAGFPAAVLHCTVRQAWCWAPGVRSELRASAETPEKEKEQDTDDHL